MVMQTQTRTSHVAARCADGRMIGPAERAAVIRKLEIEMLAAQYVSGDTFRIWMRDFARFEDLRFRLRVAIEGDQALRDLGR